MWTDTASLLSMHRCCCCSAPCLLQSQSYSSFLIKKDLDEWLSWKTAGWRFKDAVVWCTNLQSSKMLSKSESCKQQKEHSKWPKHSNWTHKKRCLEVLQRTIMLPFCHFWFWTLFLKYFGDVNKTPSFWGEAVNGGASGAEHTPTDP